MKITQSTEQSKSVDYTELLERLTAQYETIFHIKLEGYDFLYKPLSRIEYKKITSNPELSNMEKEDAICEACIVYPEDFDLDECEAGIPTQLTSVILENSFLDGVDGIINLLTYFRAEMHEFDNQMICIIHEAFQNYSIEEIESWDTMKLCKMYSRAEWKLVNLRQMEYTTDMIDFLQSLKEMTEGDVIEPPRMVETEQPVPQYQPQPKQQPVVQEDPNISKNGKVKMTPEQLEEYMEAKRKFPEIDWGADVIMKDGIEGMKDSASVVAPALRPGWGR